MKEAVKLVESLNKCTDKCTKGIIKGTIAPADCAPANGAGGTTPNDPDAQECIAKALTKMQDKINGVCIGAANPSCYPSTPGDDFATLVFGIVQNEGQYIYCGG